MGHMPYTGQAGFDLYLGKSFNELKFYRSSNFDFNNYEYEFTFFENAEINDINLHMLNFPLYASVDEVLIGIDEDATIYSEENLFPNSGKIVFYGTSITQGGCASRPGSAILK
ncbi:MAG: SGNH/GDSL hydrolase N-terminal domain-containing protein [Bacilli bacterium]